MSLIIKNGIIVNEGNTFVGSILIEGDRISGIFKNNEQLPDSLETVDASGMHIFPGVIDDQVHFREPGNTHKGTISSESAAAVLGGITSYMDMPNNNPPSITLESLERKNSIAEKESYANYSFYLGASNDNINEIIHADRSKICGLKVFMGSSTGDMLVDDLTALERIFSQSPLLIATHCESEEIIKANLADAVVKMGQNSIPFSSHDKIRTREACIESTKKAINLANRFNSRLHILHISTCEEIEMIKAAREKNPKITAEVCVHYMVFDNSDYQKYGSKIKCNPAIKSKEDKLAIIKAVKEGAIKVVATDHAPHTLEEKSNNYLKSPSGLPLVQHSLQIMLELSDEGWFTIEEVADRMAHSPALNFNIDKRGFIKEGYYADLVIVDLNKVDDISTKKPAYLCGWSPFEDKIFKSSVIHTFVNGVQVVKDSKLTGKRAGKKIEFLYD